MKPVALLIALAAAAFAQTDGITTYASRTVFVQPDQIEATISLTTPITVTQQQVADILQNAGLPARLVSASTDQSISLFDRGAQSFSYTFAHSLTGSDLREITRKLEALRTTRSTTVSRVTYGTALTASQTLIDEQFQRLLPQLIADAKKRAETLASAGGLRLGAVRSISEISSAALGARLVVSGVLGSAGGPNGSLQLAFSVAVTFAVN